MIPIVYLIVVLKTKVLGYPTILASEKNSGFMKWSTLLIPTHELLIGESSKGFDQC